MSLPDAARLAEFDAFASRLADEAREISLSYFRRPLSVETKADESPVTIADRAIETHLRQRIAATYPEHGVFGEEHGIERLDAEYVWVLDPIDGTRSFITGWPIWGTLFALLHRGRPILGIIDAPVLRERWTGIVNGKQATAHDANGKPCRTSGCTKLERASIYATSPDIFSPDELATFNEITAQAGSRRFGGDCYSYAMVAAGHVDAVVESGLQPYDYLAIAPVIEAAGGVVTDWQGEPVSVESGGRIIAAASAALHQAILNITRRMPCA